MHVENMVELAEYIRDTIFTLNSTGFHANTMTASTCIIIPVLIFHDERSTCAKGRKEDPAALLHTGKMNYGLWLRAKMAGREIWSEWKEVPNKRRTKIRYFDSTVFLEKSPSLAAEFPYQVNSLYQFLSSHRRALIPAARKDYHNYSQLRQLQSHLFGFSALNIPDPQKHRLPRRIMRAASAGVAIHCCKVHDRNLWSLPFFYKFNRLQFFLPLLSFLCTLLSTPHSSHDCTHMRTPLSHRSACFAFCLIIAAPSLIFEVPLESRAPQTKVLWILFCRYDTSHLRRENFWFIYHVRRALQLFGLTKWLSLLAITGMVTDS